MGQVGRTRRRAAAFATVPAPAAEEPRGNRSMPRGSPAAGRMKTMTGALITRFDDQVGPRERRSVRENSPRRARSSLNPRARTSSRRYRGLSDDLGGYPAISRTAAPGAAAPRTPRCAFRTRERRSDRRGPAERKWSKESATMSPLNKLPWWTRLHCRSGAGEPGSRSPSATDAPPERRPDRPARFDRSR